MKRLLRLLACLALALGAAGAQAQGRVFSQPELDSLLAPIALYPDPLLSHVLNAAVYPQDVAEAAAWSRANPRLQGDDAVRAVDAYVWHPSVKALVAYPDILARMAESPQWVADLGEAYLGQSPEVTATVQSLRQRAQASGNLQSNDQQYVYDQGGAIYVQPVYPQYVWVPYYDPFVVYGTWWWPAFRPFAFRPWYPRRVFVTHVHVHAAPPLHWHARPRTFSGAGHFVSDSPRPGQSVSTNPRAQPVSNHGFPAQPQRPVAPARSFTPLGTQAPRAQLHSPQPVTNRGFPVQAPRVQLQSPQPRARAPMPAPHIRATPQAPAPRAYASGQPGNSAFGHSRGNSSFGHSRGGGGGGGHRRG